MLTQTFCKNLCHRKGPLIISYDITADVNMNRRGSNGQSPSRGLLNGLRSLVGRQRSDSVSAVSALKKKKENRPLVKFQVGFVASQL